MPCCAAVSCSNRRENGIRLFRFPPDKERCKLWITKVKRDNWTPAPSSRLCEKHFDESQFESHRQDGWEKLRQNAVPTLFPHIALVRVRKRPAKRSPQISPSKHLCLERIRVEHPYSTTSIFPSSSSSNESSGAQHEYDVKDNTTNDAVTYPSASTMSPLDDVHSVTYCSSTKASDTAATIDCVDCQTLKSNISKLQKQLALKNRLLSQLRKKHKVCLRKIRKHTKDRVAVSGAVKIFDNMEISRPGAAAPWKPVQSGVILSTMSVLQLQDRLLSSEGFEFLLTARLSQDCLENLFSCVRSKNPVPTALEFKNYLRLLTVSQYLKGSEHGSYDLVDGDMVSDFLTFGCKTKCDDAVSDELFASCNPLLDYKSLRVVELDSTELCCLYYLAGYVLSRVENNDVTCPACIISVRATDFVVEMGTEVTSLLTLKEYRPGCLTPCNQVAFDLLLGAEIVFRQCEHSLLSASNDVRDQLMSATLDRTGDISLPECHDIKRKLIRRFFGARLQFFAKKQRANRKEKVSKKSCHEMSSKSMQMRKSVSKIK